MKKAKKMLSFLTAAAMLCGISIPAEPLTQLGTVLAAQAEDETSGFCGFMLKWKYDEATGTLTISGKGEMYDFDLASDSSAHKRTTPWLSFADDITSVNMEDGAKSIGEHAFWGCEALTSVTIPDGVIHIGDGAFNGCSALTSVTVPDSVTGVGYQAFEGTPWIEAKFEENPLWIQNGVLLSVDRTLEGECIIPDGVTSIGEYAFNSCSYVTSVTIPDGVTDIGVSAFLRCISLTSVTIPGSVTSIGNRVFSDCYSLTPMMIPDSVTSIGDYAFSGCHSLTSVTIPNNVTSIGNSAFANCSKLFTIIIENPDCEIYNFSSTLITDSYHTGTIYGYENSTAQAYAERYGYTFETLDNVPQTPVVLEMSRVSMTLDELKAANYKAVIYVHFTQTEPLRAFEFGITTDERADVTIINDALTAIKAGYDSVMGGMPVDKNNNDPNIYWMTWASSENSELSHPLCILELKLPETAAAGDRYTFTFMEQGASDDDVAAYFESLTANGKENLPYTFVDGYVEIEGEDDPTEPDTTEPETTEPETTEPDTTETDPTEPDTTEPNTTEPDTTEPETTEPNTTEPDTTEPDTTEPDTTEPDTTEPETTEPDTTEPETTEPDTTEPDTTQPDPTESTETEPDTTETIPEGSEPTETDPTEPSETGSTEPDPTEPTETDPTEPDPTEPDPTDILLGDINNDSTINAGDAAMTLSAAAAYGATGSYGNLTGAQISAADIDENGSVNASDAAYILQYAAIKGANGKEFDIRELVK